jgi:hypothetical protein
LSSPADFLSPSSLHHCAPLTPLHLTRRFVLTRSSLSRRLHRSLSRTSTPVSTLTRAPQPLHACHPMPDLFLKSFAADLPPTSLRRTSGERRSAETLAASSDSPACMLSRGRQRRGHWIQIQHRRTPSAKPGQGRPPDLGRPTWDPPGSESPGPDLFFLAPLIFHLYYYC